MRVVDAGSSVLALPLYRAVPVAQHNVGTVQNLLTKEMLSIQSAVL